MLESINPLKIDEDISCCNEEHGRGIYPDQVALDNQALPPVLILQEHIVLGKHHQPNYYHEKAEKNSTCKQSCKFRAGKKRKILLAAW